MSGTETHEPAFDSPNFQVLNYTMIKLNIQIAKTLLSRYLKKLKKGETIFLCKRNKTIVEIRPFSSKFHRKRPIGLAKVQVTIPKEFFDPLPEDVIQALHS